MSRLDHFDRGGADRDHYPEEEPPGSQAAGLVNLMRENHWTANPEANHRRDLNSLLMRTAADVSKLHKD